MSNKQRGLEYYQTILSELKINLAMLETESELYSRIPRFFRGISLNIRRKKNQIRKMKNLIERYQLEGWIN